MFKDLTFKPNDYLDPSAFHHALCTLIIALLAFSFLHYFGSSDASPWFLLSCLLFSQTGPSLEANWKTAWQAFSYLLYGFLAGSTVFLISLCAAQVFLTAFLLSVLGFIAGFLGWRNRRYFFTSFILTLLPLLAAFFPAQRNLAIERFYLILLSSFIVMISRFFYLLYQNAHADHFAKIAFFQKLKRLYWLIFYSSGSSRSFLRGELEESHFQIAWSDCLFSLRALKKKTTSVYGAHLDCLWDLTISLGSIRYRLTDFSVLTMSQDEMEALLKALLAILDEIISSPEKSSKMTVFEALQTAIQKFEELYQSMLQTVAKEPLALLLFIQDLYALKETFEELCL